MVQLSYVEDMLSADLDCRRALTGELVLLEIEKRDWHLPLLVYSMQLLTSAKTVLNILTTFSYFSVFKELNRQGLTTKKIYFLDCVSKRKRLEKSTSSHVVELDEATQLHTVFSSLLDQTDTFHDSVVCFDDLKTLQDLQKKGEFVQFFHLLLTKLRNKHIGGFIFVNKGDFDADSYAEIKSLVDHVLHL